MNLDDAVPTEAKGKLKAAGNHSLGSVWMCSDSGAHVWDYVAGATDALTMLTTSSFNFVGDANNTAWAFTYPNDDNGRENLALLLAARIDAAKANYKPGSWTQTGPDEYGIIGLEGRLSDDTLEIRAFSIFPSQIPTSSAKILCEDSSIDGTNMVFNLQKLRLQLWSTS